MLLDIVKEPLLFPSMFLISPAPITAYQRHRSLALSANPDVLEFFMFFYQKIKNSSTSG
jgi:hypothetical protein